MSLQYPVIMSKNYVNGDDTFTISSGATGQANLYDWDRATTWQSVGSDDTTNETIEVEFYEGSDTIDRDFDRLILLDTNIKDFELEYWNGSTWVSIGDTDIDNNADTNVYISFTKITSVSKVRFNMLKTITADQEKYISELIIGEFTVQLSDVRTTRDRNDISSESSFNLGTGAFKHARDYTKYSQNIPVEISVVATRNSLKTIHETNDPFIFIWAYDDLTDEEGGIFYVKWVGPWTQRQLYKGDSVIHTVIMRLREI